MSTMRKPPPILHFYSHHFYMGFTALGHAVVVSGDNNKNSKKWRFEMSQASQIRYTTQGVNDGKSGEYNPPHERPGIPFLKEAIEVLLPSPSDKEIEDRKAYHEGLHEGQKMRRDN